MVRLATVPNLLLVYMVLCHSNFQGRVCRSPHNDRGFVKRLSCASTVFILNEETRVLKQPTALRVSLLQIDSHSVEGRK